MVNCIAQEDLSNYCLDALKGIWMDGLVQNSYENVQISYPFPITVHLLTSNRER